MSGNQRRGSRRSSADGVAAAHRSRRRPSRDSAVGSTTYTALRSPTREELHSGPSRDQLPPKVKKMSRGETVCSFCGVSYLVFSEVKELEEKLREAEARLEAQTKASAASSPPDGPSSSADADAATEVPCTRGNSF